MQNFGWGYILAIQYKGCGWGIEFWLECRIVVEGTKCWLEISSCGWCTELQLRVQCSCWEYRVMNEGTEVLRFGRGYRVVVGGYRFVILGTEL